MDFACPVCGRIRPLTTRGAAAVNGGKTSGVCRNGEGCKATGYRDERYRRWWLKWAGVELSAIRAAGGSAAYVLEHGLPPDLQALADAMPDDRDPETRQGRWRKPVQAAA